MNKTISSKIPERGKDDLTQVTIRRGSVLFVGNFLSASVGNCAVCEELTERLRSLEWPLLTTSNKRARLPRLVDMVSTTWKKRKNYVAAHVDVYSGPAFRLAEAVCLMLRIAKKPYALTLHGGNLPDFSRTRSRRVARLLRSATVVTTPSEYLKSEMQIYRPDLMVLPNAVNRSLYPFRHRARPQAKLVWLRAFSHIYNPALAPRVVAALRDQYPDIKLVMIGPDKLDGSLQETKRVAAELKVSDCISFPGAVPKSQIGDWLNRSDIFLNTTNHDNTPVSVLEALACGLCVVSTNVGGLPFLLTDRKNALLVPRDSVDRMAYAVNQLLSNAELSGRISQNGRELTATFDWSHVLSSWELLLSRLIETTVTPEF